MTPQREGTEQPTAAEIAWIDRFTHGPTELTVDRMLQVGDPAPDAILTDDKGRHRRLSDAWAHGPALVVFWRHFGCGCGVDRVQRLRSEYRDLIAAGCSVVIVGMGDPRRAAAYRDAHSVPCPILCDPDEGLYRRFGLVEWQPSQVLYDAPEEFLAHSRETGESFAASRRLDGRPPVDNPWRQTGEFLVAPDGRIELAYRYQFCEDFPDPRIWSAALTSLRAANVQWTSPRIPRVAASS